MKEHTHTTKLKAIKELLVAYGLKRADASFVIEEIIDYGTLRAKNISSNPDVIKSVCDVCGSDDVIIEAPHMGKNCNRCHPL